MYKHCPLLIPTCLKGLTTCKGSKTQKNLPTTYTYEVVAKKPAVFTPLTRRVQSCWEECQNPKKWNLEADFHHPLCLPGPHPHSCSFCLFPTKATCLKAMGLYVSPGYYLKIRIRAVIPEHDFIANLSPAEELQG